MSIYRMRLPHHDGIAMCFTCFVCYLLSTNELETR